MSFQLNYHHLRYFREVAQEGHLGRVAERLNVAQSALSLQIKQLEERMGYPLFDRVGRKLLLTEAGRIALDHAERIFNAGDQLMASLQSGVSAEAPLRVGALSTLSRNFQMQFLRPLMASRTYPVVLKSGGMHMLLEELEALTLDVVLTTRVPDVDGFAAQLIASQPVGLHGQPDLVRHDNLKALLQSAPVILPSENIIRAGVENLTERLGMEPNVAARVDDMAMVRLLAREGVGVAVAPAVVVADEIASGLLQSAPFELGLEEPFYAVTLPRKFAHPALAQLMNEAIVEHSDDLA